MRNAHLKSIAEQDDRVLKLTTRMDENLSQTAKLKQEGFSLQQELFELEKKLKLFQKQRQNLMDIGESGERYTAQINDAEEAGFTLIDAIEKNQKESQALKEFESGLKKTIDEINGEALEIKSQDTKAIKDLDLRLTLLEEELPNNFREVLKKLQAKNLAHGPFTRNENGSCYFCRYKISRVDESEIDMQQLLKQCPQCSRIFLPYGS